MPPLFCFSIFPGQPHFTDFVKNSFVKNSQHPDNLPIFLHTSLSYQWNLEFPNLISLFLGRGRNRRIYHHYYNNKYKNYKVWSNCFCKLTYVIWFKKNVLLFSRSDEEIFEMPSQGSGKFKNKNSHSNIIQLFLCCSGGYTVTKSTTSFTSGGGRGQGEVTQERLKKIENIIN